MTPLSLAQVKELLGDLEEKKELKDYFKKFCKIDSDKAKKLIEELNALNNPKLKAEYVVKIVDFMPKDPENLNKIFTEISLDEKEIQEILDIVKNY